MNLLPVAIQSSIVTLFVISAILVVLTGYWSIKTARIFPVPEGIQPSQMRIASLIVPIFMGAVLLLQGSLAWGIMEFASRQVENISGPTYTRWILYDVASLGIVFALFLSASIQRDRLNYYKRLTTTIGSTDVEGRPSSGDQPHAAGGDEGASRTAELARPDDTGGAHRADGPGAPV